MSAVPIRWRPSGHRDLVAGEALFAQAIAAWQQAWFVEPALSVKAEKLLDPLEAFTVQDRAPAWSCGDDVWLFADPLQLARLADRALDLPTLLAPLSEAPSALLASVEKQLVDELFDALRHALSPALQTGERIHAREAVTPHLPYGGAHFRLVATSGVTVLSVVCGAQTLWACLPPDRRQPAASPAPAPTSRSAAIENSRISLRAMLGQCELTVAQLATLAVGDVIRLDHAITEAVALELAGAQRARRTVIGTGKPGQHAGQISIQLTSISSPDTP